MQGFLGEVASDLYGRYGTGIAELAVLFPSRRARLFFVDALSALVDRPLWQPEWLTIDDLMGEIAQLREGDRVRLVTELYKIYTQYHAEPFDKFYAWGELLLNDFDTIDKYMIDADRLFSNIADLKELEADVSYLTPEQLRIIRSFWSTLMSEGDLSQEKRKFLAVWQTLAPIYHRFKERLAELGISYAGMIQRTAAERLATGEYQPPKSRHYVIAGFNALSECEKRLFKWLATNAQTDFYWDYDTYYNNDRAQEAGLFVRENVRMFPPRGPIAHEGMRQPKSLTAVAASSNAVQCKYVAKILQGLMLPDADGTPRKLGKETAIVLTDENLLLPVLYALPQEVGQVNVTMGYPLRQSLAYTFVERLIELQKHSRRKGDRNLFYHVDVTGILAHPYISENDPTIIGALQKEIIENRRITVDGMLLARNELLTLVFSTVEGWYELSEYLTRVVTAVARVPYNGDDARRRVEFLAVIAEQISKLRNSLMECDVEMKTEIFSSLLRRTLQTLRIPFVGEPLEGLQVMGILETRNLDFENVLILSMNDDNFPGNLLSQNSFVPYNLRMAYGLPTPEHHEGVFAYYFYRLIQRAGNVWMLYCAHADDKSTGEPSRYIHQLEYESGIALRKIEVGVDVNRTLQQPIEVAKDEDVMRILARFTTADDAATLSPTAFSRYVACPLRFYFYSVACVKADNNLTDEVDNSLFGTIFHDAAQRLYEQVKGQAHPAELLQALVNQGEVERAVAEAINANYLHDAQVADADYTGNILIVKDIVTRYIRNGVVRFDAANDAFAVRGVEEEVAYAFPFEVGDRSLTIQFAGRADRIDSLDDGALRVVDYKTGKSLLKFVGFEALFHGRGKERQPNTLQTHLYAMMLHHTEGRDVEPALYYVRDMHRSDYAPQVVNGEHPENTRYVACKEEFEDYVRRTLAEIYDPAIPFRPCDDVATCEYCDFRAICRR
ncbi:MAG: PD-(D/E)XK nuclease family protein [Alistipes sp.]